MANFLTSCRNITFSRKLHSVE